MKRAFLLLSLSLIVAPGFSQNKDFPLYDQFSGKPVILGYSDDGQAVKYQDENGNVFWASYSYEPGDWSAGEGLNGFVVFDQSLYYYLINENDRYLGEGRPEFNLTLTVILLLNDELDIKEVHIFSSPKGYFYYLRRYGQYFKTLFFESKGHWKKQNPDTPFKYHVVASRVLMN